jgi:NADPH:quinone reductase-like Zn-dependent oxidoreductase
VRAARLHELGGIPRIDEIAEPEGPLLEVTIAALNPVDISIGSGRFYGGTPELPYVIGSEAIARAADGRRYWYYARGAIAERVAPLAPEQMVEVSDGVDDDLAIACGLAGLTGWLAVSWRAAVTPDDTVLVLGASGSVGGAAVQGAKVLGARRVIGAARRTDAVPEVADEAIEVEGELPSATVVIDGLWGEPAARALAAAPSGVRFVQLGQSAGATATLQSAWVRGKVANVLGHSLGSVPADVRAAGYVELCEHARTGRIRFERETYPLERVAEAWERQASGSPRAKLVIDVAARS